MKNKILNIVVSVFLLFVIVGCTRQDETNEITTDSTIPTTITTTDSSIPITITTTVFEPIQEVDYVINNNSYVKAKTISGKYLFKRGSSDYIIIVPEKSNNGESMAVDELTYFLRQSTGYNFAVKSDSDVLETGQKFISIGNTKQFKNTRIRINDDLFARSGYRIDTIDDNIYISSSSLASSNGALYGVYNLLELLVNYKFYAADEIELSTMKNISLYDFDIQYIPQIDARSIHYGSVSDDPTYRNRIKCLERFGSTEWAINGHSLLVVMPLDKYFDEHPEWYSQSKNELCLTNEEMTAEFLKNVKQYLSNNTDSLYICIAMMDDYDYCTCDKCMSAYEKYGGVETGGISGCYLNFVNKIADGVDEWLKEEYPDRTILIVAYAYHQTFIPPVTYDEAQGKYVANHEDVIPHKNVSVMFCPITQDYQYPITNVANESIAKSYDGWSAICDNVSVYEYATNFSYYLINFFNFNTIASDIQFFANAHVSYYFEQTSAATSVPCFEELRIYTESSLLWNQNQDYEELVSDFFNHYYKSASNAMYEYFSKMRTWYMKLAQDNVNVGAIYTVLLREEYWPLQVLNSFNASLDNAFKSIEYLKTVDSNLYNKLWNRINKEKLSNIYLLCNLYRGYF